jgi:predicted DNA-binding transcriptional regulator AlpA
MQTVDNAQVTRQAPICNFDSLPDNSFIRQSQLLSLQIVPFSASTLWRLIKSRRFPQPLKLSGAITAWRVGEIRAWLANPYEFGGDHE